MLKPIQQRILSSNTRVKSCKGKSNCKDNVWTQPRVMTENEIEVVKKVLIDRVEEDLINRVNYLLSLS